MRLRFLWPSIIICLLLTTTILWANNDDLVLSGMVEHTSAATLSGGDFTVESWIGLTDGQILSGGGFELSPGHVAGASQPVSAVRLQTLTTTTTFAPLLMYTMFLMLLTGVVTLGILHRSASNR
ncbi:MAG: hypothetical protein ACPG8W_22640 [Candidatus Promineifilaceae bacterium]